MNIINIRKATKQDAQSIVDCQLKMAYETEKLVLDKDIVTKGVTNLLIDSPLGYYMLAEDGDKKTLGVMMVLFEWSDWRNGKVLWIHSLYVKPEFRKQGIFKSFYAHLKNIVEFSTEFKGIRLYVEKSNLNAQKAYYAVGMTNEHYELFEWLKN